MNLFKEISLLVGKDMLLELRQKYAISGIVLYVLSTVFLVFTAVGEPIGNADSGAVGTSSKATWIAFFWMIILFASVNAVAKSFIQENSQRQLYYYTLSSPAAIILSKILYNTVLLFLLSMLTYGTVTILLGNPVRLVSLFYLLLFLGSLGFSITFTFISAIASKANNSATLMAVMSFPVIIPILLTLLRLSKNSLLLMQDTAYYKDILILLAIDVILITLSFILFPFLWRD